VRSRKDGKMKIAKIDTFPVLLRLKEVFKIANVVMRDMRFVYVKILMDNGIVGWGEAIPAWEVTGETQHSVKDAIDNYLSPNLIGKKIENYDDLQDCFETFDPEKKPQIVWGTPSAKAALDIALFDAYGKLVEKPVYQILGGRFKAIKPVAAVGIMPMEKTLETVRSKMAQGAKRIKLKVGLNMERDFNTVKAVRETFPKIDMVLDANQGYVTPKNAIKFIKKIESFGILWMEQPILADNKKGLLEVKKSVEIPVMADEAIHNYWDAQLLLEMGAVDLVNIKLMKSSGIHGALKVADLCQDYGIPCQMGSMIESTIGTAAGVHTVLSHKNIKYNELGGIERMESNIGSGITFQDHKLLISTKPGLGICLEEKELALHKLF
jgi:o-succinylbenzoate synthase